MKKAFIMPTVIVLIVVFSLAAGSLMVGLTSFVRRMDGRFSYRAQSSASELGLKFAEDWLLSSIEEGFVPKRSPCASGDALDRAEAVRPDSGRAPSGLSFDEFVVDLYVADTDYDDSLGASLNIPLIRESVTPGSGSMRCYLLRSAAISMRWRPALFCEELLAVSLDLSGKIQAVTRLFYRSGSIIRKE
ncbi:MAG: hypothetical protein LBF92_08270 [Synergistaceae bacterium]|nr:hypothetical protein [Synergistaceae bacterium]